jgi:protein SCO1/2
MAAGRTMAAAIMIVCLAGAAAAQVMPPPFEPLNIMGPNPQEQFKDIEIEQHLDAQVPLDLIFRDETGSQITLGEAMNGKPTVLALVYYSCPSLCNVVLNGVEGVVDAMKYEIGKDYNVVTVSIDPTEKPELARDKKHSHMVHLHREGADRAWYFLTGDEAAIQRLAGTVGFRYAYDPKTKQFAHAAGIMVLTPQGRISRYYYGVEYIPRDVEFGLVEASQGKVGNLIDQLTLLCFHYDPATGQYGFWVIGAMRIAAVLMILGFATMYAFLYLRARKKKHNDGGTAPGGEGSGPGRPGVLPAHEARH